MPLVYTHTHKKAAVYTSPFFRKVWDPSLAQLKGSSTHIQRVIWFYTCSESGRTHNATNSLRNKEKGKIANQYGPTIRLLCVSLPEWNSAMQKDILKSAPSLNLSRRGRKRNKSCASSLFTEIKYNNTSLLLYSWLWAFSSKPGYIVNFVLPTTFMTFSVLCTA